jgi:hypothetical protein
MAANKLILPLVGAAVVAAGGAGAYFYFNSASGDLANPLASARVVPDEAYAVTFISTDSKAWSKLEQFGTPDAQKLVKQSLENFQKQMMAETQTDYEKDLKPWVGNVMVALMPREASQKPEPSTLIVIGIKDKVSALNFANKEKSRAKVKSQESDYKGVTITDSPGEKGSTYTAVLKDYLVMSTEKQTVEKAIDTNKGEPSLAAKPGASDAFARGVNLENPIARFYVLDYAGAVQQLAASNPAAALSPSSLEQLKQIKSIVAGIGVDNMGLRLKAVANTDPQFKPVEYKNSPGTMMGQFPAETFAFVSGVGISNYWQQGVEQAKTNPELQQTLTQMRESTKSVNLDLDRDIFGWMNGEFGIGMIPSKQGFLASTGFGGVMVFDTSDRKAAETTLSKLDNLAKGNLVVQQQDVQGKKVTQWTVPGQGAVIEHGWIDQDTMFMAIGPLSNLLVNKPGQTLDGSANFKTVTGTLPKQNLGYFYLDMDISVGLLGTLMGQSGAIPAETMAVLNSIQGIGVTSNQLDKSVTQLEMLMALKPATK